MRTTLTLDADVAAGIDREVRRHSKRSQKQVINDLLRAGLRSRKQPGSEKEFKFKTYDLGLRPGLNYDDVWGLLDYAESLEQK